MAAAVPSDSAVPRVSGRDDAVSAIGTPGIPSGGMVMLVIVLRSVGVPAEGIAMILAVDRVLDMCRTVVNVTGDASVAVAVAGTEKVLIAETR